MAEAIPPTSPTPVAELLGTSGAPPDNLGGSTVNVGSNPGDLQAKMAAGADPSLALTAAGAHRGNTYICPVGVTYTPVTFPATTGAGWTCIKSNGALPSGTRVTASGAQMFKVQSVGVAAPNTARALTFAANARGYRVIGLEATHPDATDQFGLIDFASTAGRLLFERSYLHPHAAQTFMARVGMVFGSDVQVWDSWLEAWALGQDAQALFFRATTRVHLENNELRATGENIMLGDQDSAAAAVDVTIKRSHFFKPLVWRRALVSGAPNPSWDGKNWVIKNLFEIKWGHRVRLEGNVLENNWPGQGQDGTAVLCNCGIGTSGQIVDARDVMWRSNVVKNAPSMFTVSNAGAAPARLAYLNNLGLNIGGWFVFFNHAGMADLWLEHNTVVPEDGVAEIVAGGNRAAILWSSDTGWPRQTIRRNVLWHSAFGLFWDGHANMTTAQAAAAVPDRDWRENALLNAIGASAVTGFAFHSTHAAAGVDATSGVLSPTSPLKNAGSDGKDLGVDFTALIAAQQGIVAPRPSAPVTRLLSATWEP